MSAGVAHLAHAGPLLGRKDSTIPRLVPEMTAEFLKGVDTETEERRYLVAMTSVLFSILTDSI